MSIIGSNILAGVSGSQGYKIDRSLRFNSSESEYLHHTFSSAGNQKTWTFSFWIKRGLIGQDSFYIFMPVYGGDGSNECQFGFDSTDQLFILDSGGNRGSLRTTQRFRDTSAWYHIVVALDTTQSTAADRLKIYVNGDLVSSFATETYPSQDTTWGWNAAAKHDLGRYAFYGSNYFDGYMTEVNFVDGSSLNASAFGKTDPVTGAWIPKKYAGTYGSNGFYLNYSDSSAATATTLGKDGSGNGNNFTPVNFSVASNQLGDSFIDTPTSNYPTMNPNNRGVDNPTVSTGNLYFGGSSDHTIVSTFALPSSGKWYWEYSKTADTFLMAGVIGDPEATGGCLNSYLGSSANGYSVYASNGQAYNSGNNSTYMAATGTTTTVTLAFDADNRKLYVGADGNWGDGSGNTDETFANAAVAHTVASGKTYYPAGSFNSGSAYANFGQRPGGFTHTPPTGYKALNVANLPAPTIKDGTKHFNTVLFTGNGSTQSVTGVGFQPDWTWIKMRSDGSRGYALFDAVRGGTERLDSSATQEGRTNEGNISFQTDGFNVTSSHPTVNDSSDTAVAWNWKAGGSGSNNTDGALSSTVSANVTAGLSVVTYTGTGSETTVGHGLGVSPGMIWVKNRDASEAWIIDSSLITGSSNGTLHFNTDGEYTGGSNQFGTHSSSIFTVKTAGNINTSGQKYVAYVFAEVKGYSKFGKYVGNGSATVGPFVHCGFRPAWILLKNISSNGESFRIYDVKRDTFNFCDAILSPNSTSAESTAGSTNVIDIVSNGFKVRSSSGEINNNGSTMIYMAFAEMPFKYSTAR